MTEIVGMRVCFLFACDFDKLVQRVSVVGRGVFYAEYAQEYIY